MNGVPFLPPTASTAAGEFNILFIALLLIGLAVLGLVVLLLLTFCIRYRKGRTDVDRTHGVEKSWKLEIGWTSASFAVFLGLYGWGADLYLREHQPPPTASDLYVVAKQWMWKFEHPDGQREIDALHLPVGRPVRLVMASEDVIHSFSVPAFRLKQDIVPGRYVTLWFTPDKVGEYRIYCTQFCGMDHAAMTGFVTVLDDGGYQKWLADNAIAGTLAAQGGDLFRQLGCSGCHGAGSRVAAPPLTGLFGSPVALAGGGTTTVDEAFLRDAILTPAKNPPAGYAPVMPSFAGQLDEEQVTGLVAYIKSLAS